MILALLCLSASAYDGHGFELAPSDNDLDDLLTVWRPENQVPGSAAVNGLFEYAESPLVILSEAPNGTITRTPLVDDLFGVNVGVHAAFHERVAVALSAPVFFTQTSQNGSEGPTLGDMRLYAPVTLLGIPDDADRGFGIAAMPFVDIPTGNADRFLGDSSAGGGGAGTMALRFGKILLAGNLGASLSGLTENADGTSSLSDLNLNGGASFNAGLGVSYRVTDALAVRAEGTLDPSLTVNEVPWAESPGEAMLSVRGKPSEGFSWTGGGATAISPGASAALFRIFAGVGYTWGKEGALDLDGDGISNSQDACPREPETQNGFKDDDGCPDALAGVTFRVTGPDGNALPGIPITVNGEEIGRTNEQGELILADQMPDANVQAMVSPHRRTALEPQELSAFTVPEGGVTKEIKLQWLPGAVKVVAKNQDAAIVDAMVSFFGSDANPDIEPAELGDDGEGYFVLPPGYWIMLASADTFGIERRELDIKPNQRSLVVIDVTMKPAVVQTTREEVVILEQVKFAFNKADIAEESKALLLEVANNLVAFDAVKKIEVQGHTDNKGPDAYNKKLSQARVDGVMKYLLDNGVATDRLQAVGYGEACPIADNKTEAGRAANRRVQFIIVDPMPEGGVPCHDGNPARAMDQTKISVQE